MNKKLIQMDENKGISIDENSNCKVVEKENGKYHLSDILNMENMLENLRKELNDSKKKLAVNRKKDIRAKIVEYPIVLMGIPISLEGFIGGYQAAMQGNIDAGYDANKWFFACGAWFTLFTFSMIFSNVKYGSGMGREKEAKELELIISKLEGESIELEKLLEMAKEDIMYKESPISDFNINTLNKQNSNYSDKDYSVQDSSLYVDDSLYELPVYNLYVDSDEKLSKDEHTTLKKTKYNN